MLYALHSQVASAIDSDQRGGRAKLVFMVDDPKNSAFWNFFGGYRDLNTLPEGESDDIVALHAVQRKLYRISDENSASGVQFLPVASASGKLTRDMLHSGDVFMVHGDGKVYLWVGKQASLNEKKEATKRAVSYITDPANGLSAATPIERVSEGNGSLFSTQAFCLIYFLSHILSVLF